MFLRRNTDRRIDWQIGLAGCETFGALTLRLTRNISTGTWMDWLKNSEMEN